MATSRNAYPTMGGRAGLADGGMRNLMGAGQRGAPPGTSGEPLHVTVNDLGWKQNVSLRFFGDLTVCGMI